MSLKRVYYETLTRKYENTLGKKGYELENTYTEQETRLSSLNQDWG